MADIFTEVDEDLRRDRAERLWKAYGRYVIALAVAIVLATGAWAWWTDHQRRQSAAEGERFFGALASLDMDNPGPTIAALDDLRRDAKSGFRVIALLHEAGLKARARDIAGALALYDGIAADSAVAQEFRDAATVLAALVLVESRPAAEIDTRLAKLSAAGSPWRFSALEISAAAALREGTAQRARDLYARIADDPAAPQGLRARAAEMLQAIGS